VRAADGRVLVSLNMPLFFLMFYLFIHESQRERERQREKQPPPPSREPDAGLDPRTLGS